MVACWPRMHKSLDCYPRTIKEGDLQKPRNAPPPSTGVLGCIKDVLGPSTTSLLRGVVFLGVGTSCIFRTKPQKVPLLSMVSNNQDSGPGG